MWLFFHCSALNFLRYFNKLLYLIDRFCYSLTKRLWWVGETENYSSQWSLACNLLNRHFVKSSMQNVFSNKRGKRNILFRKCKETIDRQKQYNFNLHRKLKELTEKNFKAKVNWKKVWKSYVKSKIETIFLNPIYAQISVFK